MSNPQNPRAAPSYGAGSDALSSQAPSYPPPQYAGGYPSYPTEHRSQPLQQQQVPQQPGYPPSFPAHGGSAHGPSAAPVPPHSSPDALDAGSSAAYPSFPAYGHYPPAQQPSSQPPAATARSVTPSHAYVPHEATRETVVDEAIASTSEHWVKTQLRRETEKKFEQMYGTKALRREHDDTRAADRDDGCAPENRPRRTAGAGVAPSGSTYTSRRHVEFHVGSPRHVVCLSMLFFATLFGVLPLMSTFPLTVLLCGVVLAYISDYLDYHRTTIFVILGAAGLFALSLLLSNFNAAATSFGPMLMITDLGFLLAVIVAAVVQHFRWVQETFPNVLCALERLVFAVGPIVALPPLLATTTALAGARYAPFFFFLVMCTLHRYFYCPLKSSFLVVVTAEAAAPAEKQESRAVQDASATIGTVHARRRDGAADNNAHVTARDDDAEGDDDGASSQDSAATSSGAPMQLNEQAEALIFSCLLLILPVAVYNSLQSNWPDHVLANVLNSLGLACGGFAYFCVSPVQSLWFLASPPDSTYNLAQQLEYDPLGLMDLVGTYRMPVLSAVLLVGVHWGVYRVFTSRYAYLFSGVPFPFNAIVLLLAFYIAAYVAIEIKRLIDVDRRGGDVTKGKYLVRRTPVLLGSCVSVMLLCLLASVPGIFYVPSVLSVMALNLFLLDRTNGGPMFTFTVFTSLLLLWWMYRTYSFIVVDLRVFGELTVVPTPVVAVSVLWSYVLGCMSFTMSFSPNKTPLTIVLFLLALQVTFVEHVLYSQKEEGVYPALLVAFTSVVGIVVPCRMHANGVLPVYSASLIASCYVAKFFTFLVEVTSAYYAAELEVADDMHDVRAFMLVGEITGGWWVELIASHLVATFEIEKRRRVKIEAARRMFYTYAACAVVLSLLTMRNVQRAAYEFVTQSYVAEQELLHIAPGTCCITYALLTIPVWWRLQSKYPAVYPLRTISRWIALLGVVLIAVQPTRVMEETASDFDYDFAYARSGRYGTAIGLLMLVGARMTLLQRISAPLRVVWWLVAAAALALGITGLVQASPSFTFYLLMLGLVFTVLLLIDVAHYREVSSMVLFVVYGVSVIMIPLAFLQFNRSIAAQQELLGNADERVATLWDSFEQGSVRLLAVVVVVHLGLAVLLNCRISGRPLLPKCKEVSREFAMSLSVALNFSVELAVALLCAINFYANDSEPAIYVLSSLFLLIFVNDDVMFFGLREHNFRYFPPAVCAFSLLWLCAVWGAWRVGEASLSTLSQLGWIASALLQASLTVPAQISLLVLLWKGRKMGSSPGFVVVGSVVLNVLCLIFVSSKSIQWMAIVGILGQCARLFDNQLRPTTRVARRNSSL
ncbi:hypothetical protein ABB37_01349 [Leptomonas pyrrhocoris]|uniref:Transmembrane protein n=1 Tax=Leptomonas pyrrhocoris TaxID=157538 RepID=A0A0M9G8U9_LEPPY|nr:hypothetical protein ABB37_01349 [Leptomonas pyrrhocoris]KPA84896.1 hypothetical protein ABB37_01349 [Leptomonas pyrrhocoris]|eukprot:XP_015663335.1 hypothetical protein ABB37_01349 [Leptomonas pyrrhocoris]